MQLSIKNICREHGINKTTDETDGKTSSPS